jgi:hypothetical protein
MGWEEEERKKETVKIEDHGLAGDFVDEMLALSLVVVRPWHVLEDFNLTHYPAKNMPTSIMA